MPERQVLSSISPFFIVRDVARAVRFYEEGLGFRVRFASPAEDPFFAIVGRDGVQVFLKAVTEEVGPLPNPARHEWAPWDAFVSVDDPDALAEELATRSVRFHSALTDRDDGLRGFEVRDGDGYVLFFGRPAADGRG